MGTGLGLAGYNEVAQRLAGVASELTSASSLGFGACLSLTYIVLPCLLILSVCGEAAAVFLKRRPM